MNGNKLLVAIALAAIVVLGLIYVVPDRNQSPDQQASPHAINQSN